MNRLLLGRNNRDSGFCSDRNFRSNQGRILASLLIERSNIGVINSYDCYGKTAMHTAVQLDDIWLVRDLIKKKCNWNIKDKCGFSPLYYVLSIAIRRAIEEAQGITREYKEIRIRNCKI